MSAPKFIYLVRHGQSQANLDWDLLKTVPDWKVGLTEYGRQQAILAGAWIRGDIHKNFSKRLDPPAAAAYCSPYLRTKETYLYLANQITDGNLVDIYYDRDHHVSRWLTKYDPRLREQDWGNYKDSEVSKKIEADRDRYGTFFYRIPDGESGADVYDRLSTFLDTLWRDFEKPDFPKVCIIVTHGLTMRLFLMRWFHLDVEDYEQIQNPMNGEVWKMSQTDDGKWSLDTQVKHKHIEGVDPSDMGGRFKKKVDQLSEVNP